MLFTDNTSTKTHCRIQSNSNYHPISTAYSPTPLSSNSKRSRSKYFILAAPPRMESRSWDNTSRHLIKAYSWWATPTPAKPPYSIYYPILLNPPPSYPAPLSKSRTTIITLVMPTIETAVAKLRYMTCQGYTHRIYYTIW